MTEYDVKKALSQRSEKVNSETAAQSVNGIPNSVLTAVFAGKQQATSEMMGHRADLAPSIAAKMSQAFGMDVSGVQVYRSDAMNGTGMRGMAQGNKVVLGSDVDLNSLEGQAVLGHELSHIRAQSMGIGSGSGLLSDASLEHQADTEGMLAARGMSISGESMGMSMGLGMAGMDGLTAVGGGLGASAAAPMQAFWNPFNRADKPGNKTAEQAGETAVSDNESILDAESSGGPIRSFEPFDANISVMGDETERPRAVSFNDVINNAHMTLNEFNDILGSTPQGDDDGDLAPLYSDDGFFLTKEEFERDL